MDTKFQEVKKWAEAWGVGADVSINPQWAGNGKEARAVGDPGRLPGRYFLTSFLCVCPFSNLFLSHLSYLTRAHPYELISTIIKFVKGLSPNTVILRYLDLELQGVYFEGMHFRP